MIDLRAEINFDSIIADKPELEKFIAVAAKETVDKLDNADLDYHKKPTLNLNHAHFVVIDNLPKVDQDKLPKLTAAITNVIKQDPFSMSLFDILHLKVHSSKGIVEMKSEPGAVACAKLLNGFKFGAALIKAYTMKSLENIMSYPSFYTPLALPQASDLYSFLKEIEKQQFYVINSQKLQLLQYYNL